MSRSASQVARAGIGARLLALVPYVPLTGFVTDLAIRLIGGVDDWKQTALEAGVLWLIGINGIMLGSGHMIQPAPIAEGIGWAPSPFQWEVGLAGVAHGVLGVTASSFDRDYTALSPRSATAQCSAAPTMVTELGCDAAALPG